MKEWFSIPYGIAADGTVLIAEVRLTAKLRPGHLGRIAQQIRLLAALVEQPAVEEEKAPLGMDESNVSHG